MHILVVTDQHPESLGGAQVAIRQQRRQLERLGHRMTIAAPALHRDRYVTSLRDQEAYIDLPSRPITRDGEYGITWPGARTDRALAAALSRLPLVDVVHIQGDFWGAMIGLRAARGLKVPVMLTLHNNVDEGTRAVTKLAPAAFAGLRAWRYAALGRPRGTVNHHAHGAWRYLAELAAEANVVTAPSQHFATELIERGVAPAVEVIPGGVDDEAVARVRSLPRSDRHRPRFVWLGRMSQEKRVLEFIEALGIAVNERGLDAEVVLYGSGALREQVEARAAELGLVDRVSFGGAVPHRQALAAIRDADALVQTSIGFETQGLTPFEAAALGTPTVFCDPQIADDVDVVPRWLAAGESVDALARALACAGAEIGSALASGDGSAVRVSEGAADRFLQSTQTAKLLELYQSLVR